MSPARLDKKVEKPTFNTNHFITSIMETIEAWVLSHALLCLIVSICLLMALFVALIFLLTGVSATDSGVMYNQFDKVI